MKYGFLLTFFVVACGRDGKPSYKTDKNCKGLKNPCSPADVVNSKHDVEPSGIGYEEQPLALTEFTYSGNLRINWNHNREGSGVRDFSPNGAAFPQKINWAGKE